MTMTGRLYGVGTGPGDPELLTLKAVRALGEADVLAYFAKAGRSGNGRAIVEGFLDGGKPLPNMAVADQHRCLSCVGIAEGFY